MLVVLRIDLWWVSSPPFHLPPFNSISPSNPKGTGTNGRAVVIWLRGSKLPEVGAVVGAPVGATVGDGVGPKNGKHVKLEWQRSKCREGRAR
jgi:hypothetical protein